MFRVLLFLILFPSFLSAQEEIVVHLKASSTLSALTLHPIADKQSGFDRRYLLDLEKVLAFDLTHNGKTFVTQKKGESETPYSVKVEVQNKKISAFVQTKDENKIRGLEGISLTGTLSRDRRAIHLLADSIYEALFQKKGIASTRILYTVRKKNSKNSYEWLTDIWEADYDGANLRQVTHDGKLCVTPSYVAGMKEFLYVGYHTGQPKLYLAALDSGKSRRVTLMKGNQLMPSVAPTNDLMGFVCDIMGNPEIFVQKFNPKKGLEGKPWQVTSLPAGAQGSPTFSPDGKKMAFVSNKDGGARIYMSDVPAAGASAKQLKLRLISKQNRENTCPVWSPDGSKIAYSSKVQGVRQIWIYDIAADKEEMVTSGSGDKENPAWAPNSEHIIYHATTKSGSELYWINLNEKESVRVSAGSGEKRFPTWSFFS